MSPVAKSLACLLSAGALALVACGGDDESTTASESSTTTETAASSDCSPIEEVEVQLGGRHTEDEYTAADYETNPPAGGDHNPTPLEAARFYPEPPPLGETVHLLEHGAVIGWTNGLSPEDRKAVEEEFNEVFQDGYYQLAVVENPDLEVPFALSAWGALPDLRPRRHGRDQAVRRGVVRVAEDRRGGLRLPGPGALSCPTAEPAQGRSRYSSAARVGEPRLRAALERVDAVALRSPRRRRGAG